MSQSSSPHSPLPQALAHTLGRVLNRPITRLKSVAKQQAPGSFEYARKLFWRLKDRRRELQLARIAERWRTYYPLEVQSGPFAGMKYVEQAVGSALLPKLIGSYECELHSVVKALPAKAYDAVVDVGCAEGFYAVGLARMLAKTAVHAYDVNPEGRNLCRAMAALNQVSERVTVREFCSPETLQTLQIPGVLNPRVLVISDCEGYELTLLDPTLAPRLQGWDILVELHDFFHPDLTPGLTQTLIERFQGTHAITLITSAPRTPPDHPQVSFLPPEDQAMALNEYRRAGQQWAWMQARA